ncbi:MAG: DMT family transporter [Bacteroidetes bacterium]|nr:MAG: DMT family transporter [Bacteroidota bacterium]TAG86363.1 MAG: DMT family transporter [Bacteroidota bacterium]
MKNIFSKGVKLMFWAILFFAFMNVSAKSLEHLPATQLAFMRAWVVLVLCVSILCYQKSSFIGYNQKILFLRGFLGSVALITFMMTLQQMPLATAAMLQYLSPLFTAILAGLILKEKLHIFQWFFLFLSLLGVFIVKGFDIRVDWQGIGLGLFSAFCAGLAYISIRSMKNKENPTLVVFYFATVTIPTAFFAGWYDVWKIPNAKDWLLIAGMGIFTQLGQTLMTKAYQIEDASIVASVNYTGVFFAFLFGWWLFNEVFDVFTLLGMVVILIGIVLNVTFKSWKKYIFKEKNLLK